MENSDMMIAWGVGENSLQKREPKLPANTGTSNVTEILNSMIATNKVVVFSNSGCVYCLGAKNAIRKHFGRDFTKADVSFLEVDREEDKTDIQRYLKDVTGGISVPKVFINGKFVGGMDATTRLHKSGELTQMLTGKTENR